MIAVLAVAVSETSRSYWFGRFKANLERPHIFNTESLFQLAVEFAEEEQDSGKGL
jgi:hypothetical protein